MWLSQDGSGDDLDFRSFLLEDRASGFESFDSKGDDLCTLRRLCRYVESSQEVVDVGEIGAKRTARRRVGGFESSYEGNDLRKNLLSLCL